MPIGMMFLLVGLMLTIFGAVSDRAIYAHSLGWNVNLAWGVVLLIFGLLMFFAGWRGSRKRRL